MQNPTMKTPIPRCLHLGRYSARMLGKFPQVAELVTFTAKMNAITATLDSAFQTYEESKLAIVAARVDVRFADHTTDIELKNLIRRVELADGKAGGPLFSILVPDGKSALVKPFGQSQLDVLVDLAGALATLVSTWPGAAQEGLTVNGLRETYQTAIDGRTAAWKNARNLRLARNIAKQAFITGYLEISFGVKSLYPTDKAMQDLFFDDVTNEVEKDLGGDDTGTEPPGGEAPA